MGVGVGGPLEGRWRWVGEARQGRNVRLVVSLSLPVSLSLSEREPMIHALASAIKKLQRLSQDEQGTLLWRGLGGLDVAEFLASCGFTDRAFMSTPRTSATFLIAAGLY